MAIESYELFEVTGDWVTADLIVWRRYKQPAPGIVEAMLDYNPQLSVIHRTTPFIPAGTFVMVPIDPSLILGQQPPTSTSNLWTDKAGYSL